MEQNESPQKQPITTASKTETRNMPEFTRQLADTSPDLIYVEDVERRSIVYVNARVRELFGLKEDTIYAKGHNIFLEILHPDDFLPRMEHMDALENDPENNVSEIEVRLRVKDGSYNWFSIRDTICKRDGNGKALEAIAIATDINKRKAAEEARKTANLMLYTVFDASLTAIAVLKSIRNEAGVIVDFEWILASKVMEQYTGLSDLMGKRYSEVFPDQTVPGLFARYANLVNEGGSDDFEFFSDKDGRRTWYRIYATKLDDGLVMNVEDITSRKLAELKIAELNNALLKQNREMEMINSELQTFNNLAANDYDRTLRHLYTSLEFITSHDGHKLSNEGKANIRRAQAAIQKMKLLTDDIIAFSRLYTLDGDALPVDLNEVIKNVLADLQQQVQDTNAKTAYSWMPVVKGSKALLQLLFYHLISNALKFRKENVRPVIEIKAGRQQPDGSANGVANRAYHVITITDNGIGFDEEHLEKIFSMFYKVHEKGKYKGSGIGLAVCKKIMAIHEGFINAASVPGHETSFTCLFPVDPI
jgi:PAS domain S-box-containing protein